MSKGKSSGQAEGKIPNISFLARNTDTRDTGNHVLYRATPVFLPGELIAHGIKLEALSVEDGGAGLSFHVFCHNVQPGVDINYKTGDSRKRLQKYE
ncbi:hypothetical protein [Selenomonas sp. KH1T6]|uniref:hypothetical protein n=1 Tax=Selenomonas sp. KH1T6 TaxID=3158784 RepID=UPI001114AB36